MATQSSRTETIGRLAAAMRADPLARIMYGNRELFHSNILAWLCEDGSPAEMAAMFDGLVPPVTPTANGSAPQVRREWMNLDLYISWEDGRPPLVIEHKMSSTPNPEQLDRYWQKLHGPKSADPRPRAVLLSLSDPGWRAYPPESPVWHYISYGELAERLHRALPLDGTGSGASPNEQYARDTALRYIGLIRRLQQLADAIKVDDPAEPVFIDEWLSDVGDKQLVTTLRKLRAESVRIYVQRHVRESSAVTNHASGLTNTVPFVEMSYPQGRTKRSHIYGWQLQARSSGSQLC